MNAIAVEVLLQTPAEEQLVELVERKGLGHPDSICDAIADHTSLALCREYKKTFGRILHHNLDKIMLVAGESHPKIGAGTVNQPMRFIFGDRATASYLGKTIDVKNIVINTTKDWLRDHLRFVNPDIHVVFQNEIKMGSAELTELFERGIIGANDTSAAVGFAPFTQTEQIVIAVENYLNSTTFKSLFPETGEDVKIMGLRRGRELHLTVAIAFVGRLVLSHDYYFERKKEIVSNLFQFLEPWQKQFENIKVEINTLDDPTQGENGMYLTVLGISAEGADSGQVGRGNRANGLISLNRPQSIEAHSGKNPVNHVGKIYSHFANHVAGKIYSEVKGIHEVYVHLCSQIGNPIDRPLIASVKLLLRPGVILDDVKKNVEIIFAEELSKMGEFTEKLSGV
jgi:S-adenosylmethionine synthetase